MNWSLPIIIQQNFYTTRLLTITGVCLLGMGSSMHTYSTGMVAFQKMEGLWRLQIIQIWKIIVNNNIHPNLDDFRLNFPLQRLKEQISSKYGRGFSSHFGSHFKSSIAGRIFSSSFGTLFKLILLCTSSTACTLLKFDFFNEHQNSILYIIIYASDKNTRLFIQNQTHT